MKTEKDFFVPYSIAVAMRGLGFNEPCLMIYEDGANYVGEGKYDRSQRLNYFNLQVGKHLEPADFHQTTNEMVNEHYEQFDDEEEDVDEVSLNHYPHVVSCTAPTYEQTFNWIEKNYNIFASIRLLESSSLNGNKQKGMEIMFRYDIVNLNDKNPFSGITPNKKEFYTDKLDCKNDCLSDMLEYVMKKS